MPFSHFSPLVDSLEQNRQNFWQNLLAENQRRMAAGLPPAPANPMTAMQGHVLPPSPVPPPGPTGSMPGTGGFSFLAGPPPGRPAPNMAIGEKQKFVAALAAGTSRGDEIERRAHDDYTNSYEKRLLESQIGASQRNAQQWRAVNPNLPDAQRFPLAMEGGPPKPYEDRLSSERLGLSRPGAGEALARGYAAAMQRKEEEGEAAAIRAIAAAALREAKAANPGVTVISPEISPGSLPQVGPNATDEERRGARAAIQAAVRNSLKTDPSWQKLIETDTRALADAKAGREATTFGTTTLDKNLRASELVPRSESELAAIAVRRAAWEAEKDRRGQAAAIRVAARAQGMSVPELQAADVQNAMRIQAMKEYQAGNPTPLSLMVLAGSEAGRWHPGNVQSLSTGMAMQRLPETTPPEVISHMAQGLGGGLAEFAGMAASTIPFLAPDRLAGIAQRHPDDPLGFERELAAETNNPGFAAKKAQEAYGVLPYRKAQDRLNPGIAGLPPQVRQRIEIQASQGDPEAQALIAQWEQEERAAEEARARHLQRVAGQHMGTMGGGVASPFSF